MSALVVAIVAVHCIVVAGIRREGLVMRAVAVHLHHPGPDAQLIGNMTNPQVGDGDLLPVSAEPEDFATIRALVEFAHRAGATCHCITG